MVKLIELPFTVKRPILACGADLKGAFALAKGKRAILVDGFGDLGDPDNLARYGKAIEIYKRKFNIKPKIIACDQHPGYFSTRYAEDSQLQAPSSKLYKIQHHEAHIASAIVDNAINGEVIGVAFDGTGLGSDDNIWGGEFFVGGLRRFKRAAHMEYAAMPGGEAAIKEPWRMAASYLYGAFGERFLDLKIDLVKRLRKKGWVVLKKMIDKNINSPLTSSVGRLFDAAASLILLKDRARYEAELPVELEKMASEVCEDHYGFGIKSKGDIDIISPKSIFKGVAKDLARRIDGPAISAKFHNTIAEIALKVSLRLRRKSGIRKVVLSGGVFQNRYLMKRMTELLNNGGFLVYAKRNIAPADNGIPIGQVAIANSRPISAFAFNTK